MRILVTGSTGFVGSALIPFLRSDGHTVIRLLRSTPPPGSAELRWNPEAEELDAATLEGLDGVVHLAGDPIAKERWTPDKKAAIRDSRIKGTRLLAQRLAGLKRPPAVLVSASAVGYYGNRGDELLREESSPGIGFLSETAQAWEEATGAAQQAGIRVIRIRIGVVLSPRGGALAMMLPPFRLGLGGPLGSGRQWMSWIALDDLLRVIQYALTTNSLQGAVNAVAPQPVTNRGFTRTLARVLRRPAFFPVPPFALRLLFGEMAEEVLLGGARVEPTKLLQNRFQFDFPTLEQALQKLLS